MFSRLGRPKTSDLTSDLTSDFGHTNSEGCMTIGERIRKLRGALSQEEFARRINASKTAVGAYERDSSKPGADAILSICAQFDVEPKWLLAGEGPMRGDDPIEGNNPLSISNASAPWSPMATNHRVVPIAKTEVIECMDCHLAMIPMVEARLSAGTGSFENGGDSDRRYAFRTDFLSRKGQIAQMVLMRVSGDSMEPEIYHNDVVLIDQSQTTPQAGTMFAVAVEDMVYIKMVDALPGKIVLKSCNPAYAPLEIDTRGDLADGIRIVGKAIWMGREMR